jgi:predicted phage tail protein
MINIRLHGNLGKMFPGDQPDGSWLLDVKTPREAMEAIHINSDGLIQYIVEKDKEGVNYRVVIDGKDFDHSDQLFVPMKDYDSFDIIPVLQGGDLGIWGIVAGVVLIAIGIIAAPYLAAALPLVIGSGTLGGLIAGAAVSLGLALVLGGIYSLIYGGADLTANPKNRPSYLFGGQINNTTQGSPVPICYGELITGSQTISGYLTSVEINKKGDTISDTTTDVDPVDPIAEGFAPFDPNTGLQATRLPDNDGFANDADFVAPSTVVTDFSLS